MKRRTFLKASTALLAAGAATLESKASEEDAPILIFILLRGAYDATNILIPRDSSFYYESRPNIAIPMNKSISIHKGWGLHPAVYSHLKPFLDRNEVAFHPFTGLRLSNRSHFDCQERLELGIDGYSNKESKQGFLYTLANEILNLKAISFTTSIPLILTGQKQTSNMSLNLELPESTVDLFSPMLEDLYSKSKLSDSFNAAKNLAARETPNLQGKPRQENPSSGSKSLFSNQANKVASYINSGFKVAFIDLGGWDTHYNQGSMTGPLASRAEDLARGLSTLANSLGTNWSRTMVIVASEFGRTFRENGSRGTDHGYGTTYWTLGGGSVAKQTILSDIEEIKPSTLHENRDYPIQNDYRDTLAEMISQHYNMPTSNIRKIFSA